MQPPHQKPVVTKVRLRTVQVTRSAEAEPRITVTGPGDVIPLIAALFREMDITKEHMIALAVNTRNRVIGWHHVSTGTVNHAMAHPRDVFTPMLRMNAVGVIIAHNHPSGNPEPSDDDIALTNRLGAAGALLGVDLLDHIVIGLTGIDDPMPFVSIREFVTK